MNRVVADGELIVNGQEIPVVRLVDEIGSDVPALIKIDVEGFELPVLRGSGDLLERPELMALIMELNGSGTRYGVDEREILILMKDRGFIPCHYNPFSRMLQPLDGKDTSGGNTIFVRDVAGTSSRLLAAPSFSIFGLTI